jgi:alpha-ketoglutarate-dependent taurine dioxygenase
MSSVVDTPSVDVPASGMAELRIESRWSIESDVVERVLADYYGGDVAGADLTPPADPAALRSLLRGAAPGLAAVTDEMRALFNSGACGVMIPSLGLVHLSTDQRRKSVFALAVLLGNVTETEPDNHRVVWDVKAAAQEERQFSKFSQAPDEAQYHTDSTIVPIPERFFLLYAVTQAECGGGLSILRDGRQVMQTLEQSEVGRAAVRTLRETPLPIRIPRAFRRKYGATASDGYSYVPVFADKPTWRWRKDKIEHGLVKHPDCATPEVRQALDTVAEQLADPANEVRQVLPTDGIVVIDNHVAFHGRTAFTDTNRHLLRIRFHDTTENSEQSWVN